VKYFGNISLVWRKGKSFNRIVVGKIKRNVSSGVTFAYDLDGVSKAKEEGFSLYEGFPQLDKIYHENILQIFGQRIVQSERSDLDDFYDFWKIDKTLKHDLFYMLGFTQGLLPTDNFEFLADFNPIKGLTFVTEIAGLSHHNVSPKLISVGEELQYQRDLDIPEDKSAVSLWKNGVKLGYIKAVHSKVFYKGVSNFDIVVKRIEKNGKLNRVFLDVTPTED
jgi:hypothetical protein